MSCFVMVVACCLLLCVVALLLVECCLLSVVLYVGVCYALLEYVCALLIV